MSAYGDVDELNSSLGLVRAAADQSFFDELLESIQRDLFAIGGHLATPDPERVRKALEKASLSPARISEFEQIMDDADKSLPPLRAFVLPAGTGIAAALHLARTVCRRAERSVVHLTHTEAVPQLFLTLPKPIVRSAVHPCPPGQSEGRSGRFHLVGRTTEQR